MTAPLQRALADPVVLRPLRVTRVASQVDARIHNRTLVLQLIFREGPISRAEIARRSSLPRVLVSEIVAQLLEEDLVAEVGVRLSGQAGKPPKLLEVRSPDIAILAIDISDPECFTGVVTTLRGSILHRAEARVLGRRGPEALALLTDLVVRLEELADVPVLGIGIASPGTVVGKRLVRIAWSLGWTDVDLAGAIAEVSTHPVSVINDANAAALGMYVRQESDRASLLLVTMEHGLGVGQILGGALVEGDGGSAGEIGHVVVDPEGAPCVCGRRGCLETIASAGALRGRLTSSSESIDAVLREGGTSLGTVLAPVVAANGLRTVSVCGPVDIATEAFVGGVRDALAAQVPALIAQDLAVSAAPGAEGLVLEGAAGGVRASELGIA